MKKNKICRDCYRTQSFGFENHAIRKHFHFWQAANTAAMANCQASFFLYIIYIKTHLHLQTLPLPSHASFQPDIGSVMECINFPPFSPTYCRNFLTCWWRAFLGLTSSSCNPVTSPPSDKPLSKKRVLGNPSLARFTHCEILQNLQRFRNHINKKWKQQCWTIFPTASHLRVCWSSGLTYQLQQ